MSASSVEEKEIQTVPMEETQGSVGLNTVDYSLERKKSQRARYSFGIIFLVMNLVAWFFRDYGQRFKAQVRLMNLVGWFFRYYGQRVIAQVQYLKSCGIRGDDCFLTMGVLRVSLGCFIFFSVMFLTTYRTKKLWETGNTWHSGWWSLKYLLLIVSMALPFLLPSEIVQIYGEIARVGAGIFLLLQLVSVIQFIKWWSKCWTPDEESKQSCSLGLFMSTLFYIASICGVVLMYKTYAPRLSCSLNVFFITWTAILLVVMTITSLHSKVNRGLLSSGIMASYIVFLCWCAIRSEPATVKCATQNQERGNRDWTTIIGFLIAIFAIVMATFSTGIDSKSFEFLKDKAEEEDDIPYKYGFFHMIFSLGAMYFAMLFISWNLNNSAKKWSIDVGWASMWVKILNEWFAATIYLWLLISPIVRQKRVLDHNEQVQQTTDIAIAA